MGKQDKRAFWHDYKSKGRYMITLLKASSEPPLSSIDCERQIQEWANGNFSTQWSESGRIIANNLYNINTINPLLCVEQYVIMPDHVHFILNIREDTEDVLGNYIARLKSRINSSIRRKGIFESGFNDQIVSYQRNLNDLFQYVKSNPYRYAVRRLRPDFFQKQRNVFIGENEMQAYGNLFLLRNPFKTSLVVHRADTQEIFNRKKEECLYTAANGGVVVSPFISPKEKLIRKEIEAFGGKIILIHNRYFGEKEKPERHNFNLCSQGKLLLLSPLSYRELPHLEHPSRSQCLEMNSFAETLSNRR